MGRLTPGPANLGLRQAGHSWAGQLTALGFFLIGSGMLTEGVRPGPKAPTHIIFIYYIFNRIFGSRMGRI